MDAVQSLEVVKQLVDQKLKSKESVAGIQFINARGSVGTILAELSPRGKLQASMTCTEGGPDHIRERSDWHQCYLSPDKAKSKPRKTGGPNTGKTMRMADGTLVRFEDVLETDTAEVKALKEENNAAFLKLKEVKDTADAAEKQQKADARKAKTEQARQEKEAQRQKEKKEKLAAGARQIAEYARSIGAQVSPNAPQVIEAVTTDESGSANA